MTAPRLEFGRNRRPRSCLRHSAFALYNQASTRDFWVRSFSYFQFHFLSVCQFQFRCLLFFSYSSHFSAVQFARPPQITNSLPAPCWNFLQVSSVSKFFAGRRLSQLRDFRSSISGELAATRSAHWQRRINKNSKRPFRTGNDESAMGPALGLSELLAFVSVGT